MKKSCKRSRSCKKGGIHRTFFFLEPYIAASFIKNIVMNYTFPEISLFYSLLITDELILFVCQFVKKAGIAVCWEGLGYQVKGDDFRRVDASPREIISIDHIGHTFLIWFSLQFLLSIFLDTNSSCQTNQYRRADTSLIGRWPRIETF